MSAQRAHESRKSSCRMDKRQGTDGADPGKRTGTCGLCGGHNRELRILAQADFIGWACAACREQLAMCQVRRYCGSGEETEPGE